MSIKIIITEDKDTEMIEIATDGDKVLFYGNYWDFPRNGESFKNLLENAGVEVEINEKPYDNWTVRSFI